MIWKSLGIVVAVIILIIVGCAAWYSAIQTTAPSSQQTQGEDQQLNSDNSKNDEPENRLSQWGKGLALLVLIATFGFVVHQVYDENDRDLKKVSLSPVNIALVAVLIVNVMAALGLPNWWLKFWHEHMLFLLVNVGLVVAVHFYNKPSRAAKAVSIVILLILVASAFNTGSTKTTITAGKTPTKESTEVSMLGIVDVPTDKWSEEVKNPELRKVGWGRLDRTKGGTCNAMLDGET